MGIIAANLRESKQAVFEQMSVNIEQIIDLHILLSIYSFHFSIYSDRNTTYFMHKKAAASLSSCFFIYHFDEVTNEVYLGCQLASLFIKRNRSRRKGKIQTFKR